MRIRRAAGARRTCRARSAWRGLPDPTAYAATDLPPDPTVALVFYCSDPSCGAAPRAARRALQLGYRDVRAMSAGIRAWIEAGLPTESGS